MRVLLIEDDENLRNTLIKRFEETGYVVDAADNGEEGLYKGREYPADVAVIDLGLPRISGMEVIDQMAGLKTGFHAELDAQDVPLEPIIIKTVRLNQ